MGMVYIDGFGALPQLLQGRARQARRHRQRDARRHLQELGRAVHRQRPVAGGARGRQRCSTARCGRPTPTTVEKARKLPAGIDHARHRRGCRSGSQAVGGDAAKLALADEAGRRPEDARRAARADDRARRQGRRATRPSARSRSTTTSARLRPRLHRRRDRRRRRRGRDRRRPRRRPARSAACRPPT